jgi:hypothetical protein
MSLEVIINYTEKSSESELDKTLKSIQKFNVNPTTVSVCVHPPHYFRNKDRFRRKLNFYFGDNVRWNMHLLKDSLAVTNVINFAAEKSKDKYYLFMNCGYEIKDDIVDNIKEKDVFFIDPEDDQYNGFLCNVDIHKSLLGFGEEYTLMQKVEHKIEMMEEAIRNAKRKFA